MPSHTRPPPIQLAISHAFLSPASHHYSCYQLPASWFTLIRCRHITYAADYAAAETDTGIRHYAVITPAIAAADATYHVTAAAAAAMHRPRFCLVLPQRPRHHCLRRQLIRLRRLLITPHREEVTTTPPRRHLPPHILPPEAPPDGHTAIDISLIRQTS